MSATTEFDIIKKYFSCSPSRDDVVLGIGDDCALVTPPAGKQLVVTMDTLVAGVHFPVDTRAEDVAYKAIAVNLSDLASMAAQPAWLTLALTIPSVDTIWLQAFADGFHQTCKQYGLQLIGGDTTRGPLTISIQATGFVDSDRVMRRDAARPDDSIFVTGTLGDACLGLRVLTKNDPALLSQYNLAIDRLNRPQPRVAFAMDAARYCRCAIDISDGLLADLGHILSASGCGAELSLPAIPLSDQVANCIDNKAAGSVPIEWSDVLAGGDDYELCLLAPAQHEAALLQCAAVHDIRLSRVGRATQTKTLRVLDKSGKAYDTRVKGFQHFS